MVLLPLLSYIGLVNVEEVWDKQSTLEVGNVPGVADVANASAAQVDLDAEARAGQTVPATKGGGKDKLNAAAGLKQKDEKPKDLIILEASELRTQVDKSETLQIRGMTYRHVNVLTVAIQAEHAQHS